MNHQKNINRAWIVFFGIWFLLLTGTLDTWFENPGIKQWHLLKEGVQKKRQEIVEVESDSELLKETAKQLQSNPAAQEREIRRVLGYLGPNEVVFEFSQ